MSDALSNEQVVAHLTILQNEMAGVKVAMGQIAEALSKLAVLEDRYQTLMAETAKNEAKLEKLTEAVHQLQLTAAQAKGQVKGITATATTIWAVVGGVITAGVIAAFKFFFPGAN